MFKNYLKTAIRSLWRNKTFSVINIAGLAVGIAVCLVIFIVIRFELSFDQFHPKKDRIYRVLTLLKDADGVRPTSGVPYPLPVAFHHDFESQPSTAVYWDGDDQVIIPDDAGNVVKKFREDRGFFFAEPGFFEIFNFPLIAGDYKSLKDPNTAVISKETAERYFGDWHQAIGKTIRHSDHDVLKITGVLATIPDNTDFQIKVVASFATRKELWDNRDDWGSTASNYKFFTLLPEGMTAVKMNNLLKDFTKKYKPKDAAENAQVVQPLSDIHYSTDTSNFLGRVISKSLINTLWMIAGFILLIACVNFINLSTAQAVNRSKEVAVRKVVGGNRGQLKFQFYSETSLITLFAVLVAIGLAAASLPFISKILTLPVKFDVITNPSVLLFLVGMAVIVTLLAGFYPAIVLSNFNPINAFRNKRAAKSKKGVSLRRGLVVFQFIIAQGLIIGTFVIVKQMDFFRNHSMGFEKESIVNISYPSDSVSLTKLPYLKNKIAGIKGVKSVSLSFSSPADGGNWNSSFLYDHADKEVDWGANLKWADEDYLKTYGINLVAGRNITASDTPREVLVNETLLKRLGVKNPEDALNKEIVLFDVMKLPIVGVVRDFNAMPLRKALSPVIITTAREYYSKAGILFETGEMNTSLKSVENIWNEVYPDYVYERRFLDERIASFYAQENKLSKLYKIFAAIAIFLSCLGLYGLASFMAIQRVREVGIRKVLGASVGSIVLLFTREFILLIFIAFIIAAPLAWYFMHSWLQDFVYRVDISWWIVGLAGLLAIIVAMITISFKALRAAVANPVKSLRTE